MHTLATIKKQLEEYIEQPDADIHELKDMIDAVHMRNKMNNMGDEMRNQLNTGKILPDKIISNQVLEHYKEVAPYIKYKCSKTNGEAMWKDALEAATLHLELEIIESSELHILSMDASECSFYIALDGKILCSHDDRRKAKSHNKCQQEKLVLCELYCLLERITGFADYICSDDWNVFIAFLLSRAEMPYYSAEDIYEYLPLCKIWDSNMTNCQ